MSLCSNRVTDYFAALEALNYQRGVDRKAKICLKYMNHQAILKINFNLTRYFEAASGARADITLGLMNIPLVVPGFLFFPKPDIFRA